MRIFAKKSFQFDHPAGAAPAVVVPYKSFADVPDWVAESTMFKLALQDEDILVTNNKKEEKIAELSADAPSGRVRGNRRNKETDDKSEDVKEEIENAVEETAS